MSITLTQDRYIDGVLTTSGTTVTTLDAATEAYFVQAGFATWVSEPFQGGEIAMVRAVLNSSGGIDYFLGDDSTQYAALPLIDPNTGAALPIHVGSFNVNFANSFYLTGNGATNIIAYDTEEYDDMGCHSTTVNNSRITVPSGVTKLRMRLGIDTQAAPVVNSLLTYNLRKNGTGSLIQIYQRNFAAVGEYCVATTEVPELRSLVAGDYFEVLVTTTATNNFHGLVGNANRANFLAGDFYR